MSVFTSVDFHASNSCTLRNPHVFVTEDDMSTVFTYNPQITEPTPYEPYNRFISENDYIDAECLHADGIANESAFSSKYEKVNSCNVTSKTHHEILCFWCCHNMIDTEYGMPIRYDAFHKSFTTFGSFCSLECASAYNYSAHMGCNRVWEINSWIQILGIRYGMKCPIRPAPSRYLLRMFNGTLDINEFRNAHKSQAQTYVMNIPPFVHINSQLELINTSFLEKDKAAKDTTKHPSTQLQHSGGHTTAITTSSVSKKLSTIPKESIATKKPPRNISTLEKKMNLSFETT
jgi:hypothetical protein